MNSDRFALPGAVIADDEILFVVAGTRKLDLFFLEAGGAQAFSHRLGGSCDASNRIRRVDLYQLLQDFSGELLVLLPGLRCGADRNPQRERQEQSAGNWRGHLFPFRSRFRNFRNPLQPVENGTARSARAAPR